MSAKTISQLQWTLIRTPAMRPRSARGSPREERVDDLDFHGRPSLHVTHSEVPGEPVAGEQGDPLERAGALEEVAGAAGRSRAASHMGARRAQTG